MLNDHDGLKILKYWSSA